MGNETPLHLTDPEELYEWMKGRALLVHVVRVGPPKVRFLFSLWFGMVTAPSFGRKGGRMHSTSHSAFDNMHL